MPLEKETQTRQKCLFLALLPITLTGAWLYGLCVPLYGLISALFCLVLDHICYKMRKMPRPQGDLSPLITGLILSLLMPAGVPLSLLFGADLIAICIAKHPFGGYGKNAFNPAAVGFGMMLVLYPDALTTYPVPLSQQTVWGNHAQFSQGLVSTLAEGAIPRQDLFDLFLGKVAGPVAQSSVLILLGCFLFLLFTKTIDWQVPVFALVTYVSFALLFPRSLYDFYLSPIYELACGSIVFGTVFMATDPVTLPATGIGRSFCGFLLGIFVMLFRMFGQFGPGFCFGLLLINALSPVMDKGAAKIKDFFGDARRTTRNLIHKERRYASVSRSVWNREEAPSNEFSQEEDLRLMEDTKAQINSFLHSLEKEPDPSNSREEEGK